MDRWKTAYLNRKLKGTVHEITKRMGKKKKEEKRKIKMYMHIK